MHWSVLASNYPRLVLNNELPPLLLAWIERVGLASEEDLSVEMGLKTHALVRPLLDLYRNDLIHYGKSWLTVSSLGKVLVDRLGFTDYILNDFVGTLGLRQTESRAYREVIRRYRNEAFRQYLNTRSTIRAWEKLALTYLSGQDERTRITDVATGSLAFLLRDLRNWSAHAPPRVDRFEKLSGHYREYLNEGQMPDFIYGRKGARKSSIGALDLLGWCSAYQQQQKAKLPYGKKSKSAQLFYHFCRFQDSEPAEEWFDKWQESFHPLSENNLSRISKSRILLVLIDMADSGYAVHTRKTKEEMDEQWWAETTSSESSSFHRSTNILPLLLTSTSIEDFADQAGLQKEPARTLVLTLTERCKLLMKGHEKTSANPVASFSRSNVRGEPYPKNNKKRPRK